MTAPGQEDTAKALAERAWQEDPDFVEREKLVEWLGAPFRVRQRSLRYYMAHFDFSGLEIDESIRMLCSKLYVNERAAQIDRVLEAFSEHYVSQNTGSIWRLADIVHVVSFSIILVNANLQGAEPSMFTSPRFVDNTIEAIRAQMKQLQENAISSKVVANEVPVTPKATAEIDATPQTLQSPPKTPAADTAATPTAEQRSLTQQDLPDSTVSSSTLCNRDDWLVASTPLDAAECPSEAIECWITEISRELTAIYSRIRERPILQTGHAGVITSSQSINSPSLLGQSSIKTNNSLRGESPCSMLSCPAPGLGPAVGHRNCSSLSSLPHFLRTTPNTSSRQLSNTQNSPQGKTGPLLWKSMNPTRGRALKPKRWLSVVATVQGGVFNTSGATLPGSTPIRARRQLGALSLLHTLAMEVPAPKGAKVRSFGLILASGETRIFETQDVSTSAFFKNRSKPISDPDAEVQAWVHVCNYHAALYSRAPLAEAVTNLNYGWNGVGAADGDQSNTGDRPRNPILSDWAAPIPPSAEAQIDDQAQLDVWTRQVEICNAELTQHAELRDRMMHLYRPGSSQAQKALSNWEKKAQHLLQEIVKYKTYAEVLKSAELARQS